MEGVRNFDAVPDAAASVDMVACSCSEAVGPCLPDDAVEHPVGNDACDDLELPCDSAVPGLPSAPATSEQRS